LAQACYFSVIYVAQKKLMKIFKKSVYAHATTVSRDKLCFFLKIQICTLSLRSGACVGNGIKSLAKWKKHEIIANVLKNNRINRLRNFNFQYFLGSCVNHSRFSFKTWLAYLRLIGDFFRTSGSLVTKIRYMFSFMGSADTSLFATSDDSQPYFAG